MVNFKDNHIFNHTNGDLFIDMVVDRFILKNNKITLYPCLKFKPKTCVELPKTGVSFYGGVPFLF